MSINDRKGTIHIEHILFQDHALISSILSAIEFVPWRVEYMALGVCFEMQGVSPRFDEVPSWHVMPFYTVHVTQDEDGKLTSVDVQRRD